MKKLALLASARPKYAEKMMEVVNKKIVVAVGVDGLIRLMEIH